MPEGDTIYRAARALQIALAGKVVTAFETGLAKLASLNDDTPVVGRTVERVEARGKWCLIYFSGDLILVTHMLMSGSWHIYRVGEKWWMPRSKMRVAITVGGAGEPQRLKPLAFSSAANGTAEAVPLRVEEFFQAVAFNVPIAEFHTARSLERSSQVPKLGPDVLGDAFSVEAGVRAMREYGAAHPDAEVGVVLLNQRVMAGLGNVYKSEVAFAAEVNPFRRMSTVTAREMEKMVETSQKYMKANVADGGGARGESGEGIVTYTGPRRTTHSMAQSDRVWVYGRQGQECRRCGTAVMMRKQGEQARSTYWCPSCQPWVAAEGKVRRRRWGSRWI
jgi:endonuclease-8